MFKKGMKTKSEYEAVAVLAQDRKKIQAVERDSPKRDTEVL